ncbi:MAG: hypothetical protein HQ555_11975 [Candidatus Aminicenantes bacterium]|nr:hypothetical protein [Candidatus Aminicenantes bacterium]
MDKNEIELIDFLNIIWKRKWLILLFTSILVIVTGVISFLLPPKWEIDALIQPSKFLVQTAEGQFEEIMVENPKQIASQINQAAYNYKIATELSLDFLKFPKLRAENLQETSLVRVSIKEKDSERAKLILNSLFNHIKIELDKKVEIESKGIDSQIKSKEIEKSRIKEEIKSNKNKLKIVNLRKKEIGKEINDVKKRVESLEEEQRKSLKKENRSESESLAMLLYSNEIQQSLMNYNTLNELLSSKKIEEENINLEIENKEERIKQLDNEIESFKERKGRIDYTQLIKEPTSSLSPVSPKKKLNILIAGILGLMISTILAFFLEYIKSQRVKD